MEKTGMIDVGGKKKTKRMARAQAFVRLDKEIIQKIKDDLLPKGNVLENARVAAILAAKNTASQHGSRTFKSGFPFTRHLLEQHHGDRVSSPSPCFQSSTRAARESMPKEDWDTFVDFAEEKTAWRVEGS